MILHVYVSVLIGFNCLIFLLVNIWREYAENYCEGYRYRYRYLWESLHTDKTVWSEIIAPFMGSTFIIFVFGWPMYEDRFHILNYMTPPAVVFLYLVIQYNYWRKILQSMDPAML